MKSRLTVLAICTFWGTLLLSGLVSTAQGAPRPEIFAAHKRTQIQRGATVLPLAAQFEYRTALQYAREGDLQRAEQHLNAAIKLAPTFPDAYFTLSKTKFRQFDADALYYLIGGVSAMWNNYSAHSLLAVNVLLIGMLALIGAISITFSAFALRYIPFVAHRLGELMGRRFRAAMPLTAAYLFIMVPFALFPGFVTGACMLLVMTWHFMHRREKFGLTLLLAPLVLTGLLAPQLERFSVMADPESFTNLAARSNYSAGSQELINALARTDVPQLEAEKNSALGLLYLRQGEYETAAVHLLESIALRPGDASGYINLGNVYFSQGQWHKALEGYRKAGSVDSLDAVGQHNLAQAYIKTLLMAESTKALHRATEAGIGKVRKSFAVAALPMFEVYPKTLSPKQLWSIAAAEGESSRRPGIVAAALEPVLGFSLRVSAWMLLAALLISAALSRMLKPRHLAFQCANCGQLMCESCGNDERGTLICRSCHNVIAEVSSEKVVDALLRRRRQKIVVTRRKRLRQLTVWLPGLRDAFYGRLLKSTAVSLLFAVSAIMLWSRGYVWTDWNSLIYPTSLWKWIVPAAGIVVSYLLSASSKRHVEVRNYRNPESRQRQGERDEPRHAKSA